MRDVLERILEKIDCRRGTDYKRVYLRFKKALAEARSLRQRARLLEILSNLYRVVEGACNEGALSKLECDFAKFSLRLGEHELYRFSLERST